jgi:hypothetical protein
VTGPLLLTAEELAQLKAEGAVVGRRSRRRGLRLPVAVEKDPQLAVAALRAKLQESGFQIVPAIGRGDHRRTRRIAREPRSRPVRPLLWLAKAATVAGLLMTLGILLHC